MNKKTHKLFVYGILVGRFDGRIHAKLYGYKKIFRNFATFCKSDSDFISGELVTLTDEELAMTDMIEGYPNYYHRLKVSVETVNGVVDDVWVYQHVEDKLK